MHPGQRLPGSHGVAVTGEPLHDTGRRFDDDLDIAGTVADDAKTAIGDVDVVALRRGVEGAASGSDDHSPVGVEMLAGRVLGADDGSRGRDVVGTSERDDLDVAELP